MILTAKEVRSIRERLDMTQAEMGEAIGVTQTAVSNWEKGLRECSGPAALMLSGLESQHKRRLQSALDTRTTL